MSRPVPPPNQKIRDGASGVAVLVMVGAWVVGFAVYMAGLYAGAIHCNHRCYWCGKHLEATAE